MRRKISELNPVPPAQRPYIAGHPIGIMVSFGLLFSGIVGLIGVFVPGLVSESAIALLLPTAIYAAFNAVSVVGGAAAVTGFLTGRLDIEAAGMSLLSSALLSYFVAIVAVRPTSAIQIQFVLWLGVGCALRVLHLTRSDNPRS